AKQEVANVAEGAAGGASAAWISRLLRWGGPVGTFLALMRPASTVSGAEENRQIAYSYVDAMRRVLQPGETTAEWAERNLHDTVPGWPRGYMEARPLRPIEGPIGTVE